jgi:hypothetical protein
MSSVSGSHHPQQRRVLTRPLAVLYRIRNIRTHPLSEWWFAADAGALSVTLSRASRVADGDMVIVITAGARLPEAQPWTKSITIYGAQLHRWAIPVEQVMHLYAAHWQVEGEDVSHILYQPPGEHIHEYWTDSVSSCENDDDDSHTMNKPSL